MNGEWGAPAGQASQHTTTIKNNDKDKLPFLCGWHRANAVLPLSISVVRCRWRRGKGDGEGGGLPWEGSERPQQPQRDVADLPAKSQRKRLSPPNPSAPSLLSACYQHAGSVECNAVKLGRDTDLCRSFCRGPHRTVRELRPLARSRDGDAHCPSAPAPATLPSSGTLPPASLSTCTRSSPSRTPFTTGAWRTSRRLVRQGGAVRGCSRHSARWGGRGEGEDEGEDTDQMLDCAAFWRNFECWRGGHGGPIAFVGGRRACIG